MLHEARACPRGCAPTAADLCCRESTLARCNYVRRASRGRRPGLQNVGQKMSAEGSRLTESERGVWFWLKRYSICTPQFFK